MSKIQVGQVLLGRYRIDAFIDAGGMSNVYRVHDLQRDVDLAMKVLRGDFADDSSAFKRFQREADALRDLQHPNIVPFYGAHQVDDFAFLLEAYVDGPSLKDILQQRGGKPLSSSEALVYLKALCAALGYAHANGIVHCDVKPGNVMIDQGGAIYLTDFGIARHADSATTTLAGAGTAAYITPEQIRSGRVSAATDVYALGIILYEMVAGRRPFRGNEPGTERGGDTANERIRYAHLHLPPLDPSAVNPSIPAGLARVILKALNKQPGDRYASTRSFLAAACEAAGVAVDALPERVRMSAAAGPARAPAGTPEARPPQPPPPVAGTYTPPARKPIPPWLWAVGGTLVIIIIILLAGRPGPDLGGFTQPAPGVAATEMQPTAAPPASEPALPPTEPSEPLPTSPPETVDTQPPASGFSLVFASDRGGAFNAYLMNPQSSDWAIVGRPPGYDVAIWPTFCGNRIAVEAQDTTHQNQQWIYLIDPLDRNATRFEPSQPSDVLGVPSCSPDSRFIAYSRLVDGNWPMKIDAYPAGDHIRTISDPEFVSNASWNSDSSELYYMTYQRNWSLYEIHSLDGIRTGSVGGNPAGSQTDDGSTISQWMFPAISPDGSKIAFICSIGDSDWLCMSDTGKQRTTALRQIVYVRDAAERWGGIISGGTPVWSRDGNWIYYSSGDAGNWDIYAIRPDGTGIRNLTSDWPSNELMPNTR